MSSPASLDTNVIFLCGELSHLFHRALTTEFRKHKIRVTVEQFSVLVLLFYRDGINQQEISTQLNRNKTTITRVIANMERSKMIVRVTDKTDGRGKLIFLTKKGKTIQQRAIQYSGAMYMKAIAGLSRNLLEQGVRALSTIIHNIK